MITKIALSILISTPFIVNAKTICINNCDPLTEVNEIIEEDMRDRMEREVAAVDWAKKQQAAQDQLYDQLHSSSSVTNLTVPEEDTVRFFNSGVIANQDIYGYKVKKDIASNLDMKIESIDDLEPVIVVKEGTVVNPLDHITPRTIMFVFDPTYKAQKELALSLANKKEKNRFVFIAVQGDLIEIKEKLGKHVFYLNKDLADRLQLEYSPTFVTTENKQIKLLSFAYPFVPEKIFKSLGL